MKKSLRFMSFILALILMTTFVASNIDAAAYYNTNLINNSIVIKIGSNDALINGAFAKVDANSNVTPYISQDRTMVPVRFVTEALAANVGYEAATQKVTIIRGNVNVTLIIGSKIMIVNGSAIQMDVAATLNYDRTFIPYAYVAEALGMNKFYKDGLIIMSNPGIVVNQVTDLDTINFLSSQLLTEAQKSTQPPTVPQPPVITQPTYPQTPTTSMVSKITVTPTSRTIKETDEVDGEVKVIAYYTSGGFAYVTEQCKFTSSNEKVAYVKNNKLYSGSKEGKADITVSYTYMGKEVRETIKVTVTDKGNKAVERIVASPAKFFFSEEETKGDKVKVIAYYSDGSTEDVTDDCDFKSEDKDVAYVKSGRLYSGDEEGEVTIEVTYEDDDDEEHEAEIIVTFEEGEEPEKTLKKIVVTPDEYEFDDTEDEGDKVKVVAHYSDGSTATVTDKCNFESEDIEIAYIDGKLRICSGEEGGKTEITVTYAENGKEVEAEIEVEVEEDDDDDDDDELVRIVALPAYYFFDDTDEEGAEITVYAYYADGSYKDVTLDCDYDSDDEDVAYVEEERKKRILCSGDDEDDVTITVKYKGMKDKIEVEVEEDGEPERTLKKIKVSPSSEEFDETNDRGSTIKVTATYSDGDTEDVTKDCIFKDYDEDIAYIDSKFRICSGDDEGDTEIVVVYQENDDEKEVEIEIEVEE